MYPITNGEITRFFINKIEFIRFDFPFIKKRKALGFQGLQDLWRRPESNRCPNITAKSFLHAYFLIACRKRTGKKQTNPLRSCMVLKPPSQPLVAALCIGFKSAAARGNRQTRCAAALMTAKSLIRQPWHTVYCHLLF